MIDVELLRSDPDRIRAELKKRFISSPTIDEVIALDEKRRAAIHKVELLRADQKKISEEVAKAPAAKKKELVASAKKMAEQIKLLEPTRQAAEAKFLELAALLPNFTHESVPTGETAKQDKVIATHGVAPKFDFVPKTHWQLAESHGWLDGKRGARVAGSRFNYYSGDLVLLDFAILQFALNEITQNGFVPMLTPQMATEEAMYGSGMFPVDKQEVYSLPEDKLYLIGTSEITLLNYHAHETLTLAQAPLKYTGFSSCYRREAGAAGKEMRGMVRTHQFEKLEMFVFASQEDSWRIFEEELISLAEGLLQKLGLHYQKIVLATGDLPRKFQKTYDLETWLPSEKRFIETGSISHAGDFQARRLGIKYVNGNGERRYAHTLNATGITFSRIPAVILEQFQQADGRVRIPEVLQPYINNREYLG